MEKDDFHLIDLYQFEYKYIPELIELTKENTNSPAEFLYYLSDLDWILNTGESAFHLKYNFDTSEIRITCTTAHKKNFIIVFSFPNPKESPLAKFGAIILNSQGIKYYTLEMASMFTHESNDQQHEWMLGSMSKGIHSNYGQVKDCSTIEDFVSLLEEKRFMDRQMGLVNRLLKIFGLLQRKN